MQAKWGREKPKVAANDLRNARAGCFVVLPRAVRSSPCLVGGAYPRPKGNH